MGHTQLGTGTVVDENATVGYEYDANTGDTVLGDDATVRAGTVIYADVHAGDRFTTGHNVLVREHTEIGDDVLVGTNTVIDGTTTIGSKVSLQSNVYIPTETEIGDSVFVGPGAVLTNDPYPVRTDVDLVGPTLADNVSVGANATLLPGITVGEGAFVAAGAVVCADVPPRTLVAGVPAKTHSLPEALEGVNSIA